MQCGCVTHVLHADARRGRVPRRGPSETSAHPQTTHSSCRAARASRSAAPQLGRARVGGTRVRCARRLDPPVRRATAVSVRRAHAPRACGSGAQTPTQGRRRHSRVGTGALRRMEHREHVLGRVEHHCLRERQPGASGLRCEGRSRRPLQRERGREGGRRRGREREREGEREQTERDTQTGSPAGVRHARHGPVVYRHRRHDDGHELVM